MTIIEALNITQQRLNLISDTARLDAECLLCFVLDKPDVYLRTWPEMVLSAEQQIFFERLVLRREQGEPIAYIVEQKEFWSLNFKVNKHTLIPRPDTELLVQQVLDINKQQALKSILELATGSGAIAVSIATEFNAINDIVKLLATDISEQALGVARFNAERYQQNIEFIESDWFNNIPKQQFDLIVVNPPYIEENDSHLTQGDVRFEPNAALVSGIDGLTAIRTIIKQAKSWLQPNGWLLVEHGYNQAAAVQKLFADCGYSAVKTKQDLSQVDRITYAVSS